MCCLLAYCFFFISQFFVDFLLQYLIMGFTNTLSANVDRKLNKDGKYCVKVHVSIRVLPIDRSNVFTTRLVDKRFTVVDISVRSRRSVQDVSQSQVFRKLCFCWGHAWRHTWWRFVTDGISLLLTSLCGWRSHKSQVILFWCALSQFINHRYF